MCPCNDPPRNHEAPPLLRFLRVVGVVALFSLPLLDAYPVSAQTRQARIHPAVVRVIAQDGSGRSLGSGALVAATDSFGLVLTNWHVIRDAAAPPVVVFPDGFQSAATIAKVDRDWDLAALVIWRPRADPIRLAATAPRPGDPLAIAGYGKGQYGVDTGRCTQYLSPGKHHPYELVELSASARQGDSGGPIFNDRGELAGVLFGSAFGKTTGSHSGRVRQFLAPLWNDFYQQRSDGETMIAGPSRSDAPVASIRGVCPVARITTGAGPPNASAVLSTSESHPSPVFAPPNRHGPVASTVPYQSPGKPTNLPKPAVSGISPEPGSITDSTYSQHSQSNGSTMPWQAATPESELNECAPSGVPSRSDQLKTILAAIGILALVFHGVRLLGRAVEV